MELCEITFLDFVKFLFLDFLNNLFDQNSKTQCKTIETTGNCRNHQGTELEFENLVAHVHGV